MGSTIKLVLIACLIGAVCQLQFTAAGTFSKPSADDLIKLHSNASHPAGQSKTSSDKVARGYRNADYPATEDDDEHEEEARGYRSYRSYRSVAKDQKEPDWEPNNTPQSFSYKLTDHIKGADQFREEKVNNGEVTGSWAVPVDESGKMFRKTEYRAGKDGFHIVSEKLVPAEELGVMKTNPDEANVEIEQLGGNTAYTVKGSDLKKTAAQQKAQAAQVKRGY